MTQLKIIPGEMRNINPNEISLVKKGANGISAVIAKADETEESVQITKEEKGFLQTLRNLFNVEKADKTKTVSFADRMAVSEITDGMWRVNDTLSATLRDILNDDTNTDKKAAMNTAIDEYAAYMKKRIENVGKKEIAKSIEEFLETAKIEKAGKSISAANMKKIQDALNALKGIIEVEEVEEMEGIKKEDIENAIVQGISKVVEPITNRLEALEKGNTEEVQKSDEEKFSDMITGAITKAFEPLADRISKIEKARAGSKQLEGRGIEEIQKGNDVWTGFSPF